MASGRDHDRATSLWALPLAGLLAMLLGGWAGALGGLAFLMGGLWLSPDLDTHSRALNRWGPLRWIWWPYRRLLPHRSLFSHGPVIGMALRLGWLLILLLLVWQALAWLPLPWVPNIQEGLPRLLQQLVGQPNALLAVLLGLEASVWLHLILDGDPLPAEWRARRRR